MRPYRLGRPGNFLITPLPSDAHHHRNLTCAEFDSSNFVVGCDIAGGAPSNHFAGAIDRLRFWKFLLEPSEINGLASGESIERPEQFVWSWRFGGDTHLVEDLSGAGHHSRKTQADSEHRPAVAEPEIWIGAGRCYVEGVGSQIDEAVRFDLQPSLPGTQLPSHAQRAHHRGPYLAYLNSWDRIVTAVEDEGMREPALAGLDTAVRQQIVSQVKIVRGDALDAAVAMRRQSGTLKIRRIAGVPLAKNRLLRIEIHEPGFPLGMPIPKEHHTTEGLAIAAFETNGSIKLADAGGEKWKSGRLVECVRPGLAKAITATVKSVTIADDGLPLLMLSIDAGTTLAGDSAHWRLRPIASFKWSLDNGAWLFPVTDADPATGTFTIDEIVERRGLLRESGWVEVISRDDALCRQPGIFGQIGGIQDDAPYKTKVILDLATTAPVAFARGGDDGKLQLRVWEAIEVMGRTVGAATLEFGVPIPLASGIELEFGAGIYQTEDYWTVAARDALEWPCDQNGQPQFVAPHGIRDRFAALALIHFCGGSVQVQDLRQVFEPLSKRRAQKAPQLPLGATASVPAVDETVANLPLSSERGALHDENLLIGSKRSPPGWHYMGARLAIPYQEPEWQVVPLEMPIESPLFAAEMDERVYVLDTANQLWSLDVASGDWQILRPIAEENFNACGMSSIDGRLHVIGLTGKTDRGAGHRAYHPDRDAWDACAPMPTARMKFGLAASKGLLFAAGGLRPGSRRLLDTVEVYEPGRDVWRTQKPLPQVIAGAGLVAAQGRLYLIGGLISHNLGISRQVTNHVSIYSPASDKWTGGVPLESARSDAHVVATDNRLHVIGGIGTDSQPLSDEMLDVKTGQWLETPQPHHRHSGRLSVAVNGSLYRFGRTSSMAKLSIERCAFDRILYAHSR